MADQRAALYNELKAMGYKFEKPYQQYKTAELDAIKVRLFEEAARARTQQAPQTNMAAAADAAEAPRQKPQPQRKGREIPVAHMDPNEMAGQRLNSQPEDEPIRIDPTTGRAWFQEEVRKPATAKPRGRRVLRQPGSTVKEVTITSGERGEMTETFEVAGDRTTVDTEIKITLPSYQVGIYKDRRFPFKVICYNNNEGFKREEVERFYGGSALVPKGIKRIYVSNVLCYDIRTTIDAIQAEDRRNQLSRVPQGGAFS